VAQAAADFGISHLVQMSAIGADADSPAAYARTKAEGEQAVFARVPSATVLRPSVIFGRRISSSIVSRTWRPRRRPCP
jgi:NADH dehydrogenase